MLKMPDTRLSTCNPSHAPEDATRDPTRLTGESGGGQQQEAREYRLQRTRSLQNRALHRRHVKVTWVTGDLGSETFLGDMRSHNSVVGEHVPQVTFACPIKTI